MLPFIDLHIADYCRMAFNYCLGLYLPIGRSLWFDRQEVVRAGKAAHLNLDEYLTGLLASLFFQEKAALRILIFYAAIPERFALSLCSADGVNLFEPSQPTTDLPGCVDLRHDFIPQTAAPFLLYDGRVVYRLYQLDRPDRTAFYVWDFGDCLGNFLKEVDKTFYFRVLNDKNTYYEYSVVPKNPCTSIQYLGRSIPVHHAFFAMKVGNAHSTI
jgi:hypothetical protein